MRREDWAVLAFKMIGAAFAGYGVIALAMVLGVFAPNPTGVEMPAWAGLAALVPSWLMLGVGGAFWVGAPSIAARVYKDDPPPDFAEPLDVKGALQVALALLGTYFIVEGVAQLVSGAGLYIYSRRISTLALGYDPDRQNMVFGASAQAALMAAVAREALGWFLVMNRARIASKLKPTRVVNPFAEEDAAD